MYARAFVVNDEDLDAYRPLANCTYFGGQYQFEQVSSDSNQMLLASGRAGVGGSLCPMCGGGGVGVYSEVQCIMGHGHMGPPLSPEHNDR